MWAKFVLHFALHSFSLVMVRCFFFSSSSMSRMVQVRWHSIAHFSIATCEFISTDIFKIQKTENSICERSEVPRKWLYRTLNIRLLCRYTHNSPANICEMLVRIRNRIGKSIVQILFTYFWNIYYWSRCNCVMRILV